MSARSTVILALTAAACTLGACGVTDSGVNCTDELRTNVRPAGDTTVAVGEQFDVSVALSTCGGRTPVNDSFTLATEDPSVVTVNSMKVSAVGEGATRVIVNGATYGRVATIYVTVTQ